LVENKINEQIIHELKSAAEVMNFSSSKEDLQNDKEAK
jgi:hypothetical protein